MYLNFSLTSIETQYYVSIYNYVYYSTVLVFKTTANSRRENITLNQYILSSISKQYLHLVYFSKCSITNFIYNFPHIQWILVALYIL